MSQSSKRKHGADSDAESIDRLSTTELQNELEKLGLPTDGSKVELRKRLVAADLRDLEEGRYVKRAKREHTAHRMRGDSFRTPSGAPNFLLGSLPLQAANQKKVLVIYTGGTIGMRKSVTGTWEPAKGYLSEQLINLENRDKLPRFDIIEFDPLLDSSDMEPQEWVLLAEHVHKHYNAYDGFVVLHGTDTMAYTASALSFMLENLCKPVVVTGSCVPFCEIYNDAWRNVVVSLILAGTSNIPEVVIFFDDLVLRGNRATKADAWGLDGFKSFNCSPLGRLGNKIEIFWNRILPLPISHRTKELLPLTVRTLLDVNIVCIHLLPGFAEGAIESVVHDTSLRGIVLRAYGAGNAPKRKRKLLEALRLACEREVVVVVLSQCQKGAVALMEYATGEELSRTGVVSGLDMTVEAAATKLAFLLGRDPPLSCENVKRLMSKNLAGELTESQQLYPSDSSPLCAVVDSGEETDTSALPTLPVNPQGVPALT